MSMSRRALALTIATTISCAGLALPAQAADNTGGASASSSSTPSVSEAPRPSTSTTRVSEPPRPSTSAKAPEASGPPKPSTSLPKVSTSSLSPTATTVPHADDKAKATTESLRVIDTLVRKLKASSLDPTVRDGLIARLLDMKASFAAGQLANPAAVKALAAEIIAALRLGEHAEDSTTTVAGATTVAEVEDAAEKAKDKEKAHAVHVRTTEVLQAQIDKITASDLPDDVKSKVVAALTEAKQSVADHVDAANVAKEIHDTLEQKRAARFAEMSNRLAAAADRVQAAIDRAAAKPGNETAVADANAKLTSAREQLAAATTTADLKAVYQLLHDIHRSLPHVEAPAPSTTVEPTTTVAPSTTVEPTTTVAPPTTVSV